MSTALLHPGSCINICMRTVEATAANSFLANLYREEVTNGIRILSLQPARRINICIWYSTLQSSLFSYVPCVGYNEPEVDASPNSCYVIVIFV